MWVKERERVRQRVPLRQMLRLVLKIAFYLFFHTLNYHHMLHTHTHTHSRVYQIFVAGFHFHQSCWDHRWLFTRRASMQHRTSEFCALHLLRSLFICSAFIILRLCSIAVYCNAVPALNQMQKYCAIAAELVRASPESALLEKKNVSSHIRDDEWSKE